MKRRILCLMASLLLCGAVSAQHFTSPDAHAKSGNTPIVAAVTVDNAAPATGAELAVYVGNELRGLATTTLDGKYWVQAFYNSGSTETLTFKLWNPADGGAELDTYTLTYTYTDSNNQTVTLDALTTCEEGYGTPSNPVQIAFTATQTQTMQFAQGWNWWSSYVDADPAQALTMLEEGLGNNGLMIVAQNSNVQNYYPYYNMNYWAGTLNQINVEKGYKIQTSQPISSVVMSGGIVDPSSHPITITPNWNWIGYPLRISQSISNALGDENGNDFIPESNDIITSQSVSATYWAGWGWFSSTNMELNPGNLYLYNSNATQNKTLVYREGNAKSVGIDSKTTCFWQNDFYAYPDNVVMVTMVSVDGKEQRNEEIEIGAFVNGECRGSSYLRYFEPLDRYYAVLTIKGQDDDFIEFGFIDHSNGSAGIDNKSIVFKSNLILGSLDNPYELQFNSQNNSFGIINLYPNPVNRNEAFSIIIPEGETIEELCITNALGIIIRRQTGAIALSDVAGLPNAGVYFIRIVCKSGKTYINKLIVK